VATPIETEAVAIGLRQLVSDLVRALALAIGNENLQRCSVHFLPNNVGAT
jgi:hypothetical protein